MPEVSLWDGNIISVIPENYFDLSKLREVPDNQEIFVTTEKGLDDSIVFDLLEKEQGPSDLEAFGSHIEELANLNQTSNNYRIIMMNSVLSSEFPSYLALTVGKAKKWGRESQDLHKPILVMINGLIRLEKVSCDIIISYNLPTESEKDTIEMEEIMNQTTEQLPLKEWTPTGNYDFNKRIAEGLEIVETAIRSLKIIDWKLFEEKEL